VVAPLGWTEITDYAAGKGAKPDCPRAHQTLNELLEAMPASRCRYRPEVISAIFRRPPLTIPAFGFGFRGQGESYKTAAGVPLPAFRSDDLVTIRRAGGTDAGELDWSRTPRRTADGLLVGLGPGDWVAYDIVVPSSSRFQIVVASKPPALDILIDGTLIEVERTAEATVRGTTPQLDAGRHVVRLTGLSRETLVQSIEVAPAPVS